MAKFRKKPVVIEAVQLTWDTWSEMCEFIGDRFVLDGFMGCYVDGAGKATDAVTETMGLKIPTLEGEMLGVQNDWIIKGVKGEFYPCKPDIFAATYEREPDEGFVIVGQSNQTMCSAAAISMMWNEDYKGPCPRCEKPIYELSGDRYAHVGCSKD
jgi:hypothetical protein